MQTPFRSLNLKPPALAVLCLLVLAAGPATSETLRFDGDRLTVRNLIGEVRVEGARGAGFEVEVKLGGRDATPDALRFDSRSDELDIVFPEGVGEYVYPAMRGDSTTEIKQRDGNGLAAVLGADRVKVRASGSGRELWADVTIRMPAGSRLTVEHGVGLVAARGVRGEVELATRSGNVALEDAEGKLSVATGSGDVTLDRVGGEKVSVVTGSGAVHGEAVDGDEIHVATGSGDVTLRDVRGRSIQFATGSGEVTLDLSGLGDGKVSVGTGSGDIALSLPADASVELHAETDGGRIAVDLDQAVYRVREADEVELTVGGGAARVRLGSGNGDIRIGR